ncbi:MAG TPA: hypothetical protein VM053_09715 [Gemmatimonadaceae bacterium]|nr:hypothetical protein [Gemmatimonadaceae bacterium]
MKRILPVVFLLTVASTAGAQVRRRAPVPAAPQSWVTASVGLFNGNTVADGRTGSEWRLGEATDLQFRLAAEQELQGRSNISVGAVATYTHAPFTYLGGGGENSCTRCAAHLNMTSLGASFHAGGGIGLHQVVEASAGAIRFSELKRDSDGSALLPTGGNIDPYFTFGYGFGYTINPTTQISVVQDFGFALHERTGLTSEQSNSLRLRTIRLNVRYGFGDKTKKRQ